MTGIYGLRNDNTGKWYVGQALNVEMRRIEHLSHLRTGKHHSAKLQNSFNKHGEAAFSFYVLQEVEVPSLDDMEVAWIARLDAYANGYNMTTGGGGRRGYTLSEETKAKISAAHKGRAKTEECRRKIREANLGRKVPTETRAKISRSTKGENAYWYGKHHTEETKQKLREAHGGANHRLYGGHHTAETKKAISEQLTGNHNAPEKIVRCITTGAIYRSTKEAGRLTNLSASSISMCCRGERKSCGGMKWEYVDNGGGNGGGATVLRD